MCAVAFGGDAQAVIDYPPYLIAPVAIVLAIAILGTALMRSDIEHRGEAVVDPLTRLLNRKALDYRKVELAQQSALSGEPVGLIVCDLDHFKQINDTAGHIEGDAVLKQVADVLREQLALSTPPTGSAARSSWSCSPAPASRRRPSWPSACAPLSPRRATGGSR
jgi:hypothetical protein